jgi:hypothetical protein
MEITVKVVIFMIGAVTFGFLIHLRTVKNVNPDLNCADDRAYCQDYHEGLCMATTNKKGHPSRISQMKKCPFGTVADVIK